MTDYRTPGGVFVAIWFAVFMAVSAVAGITIVGMATDFASWMSWVAQLIGALTATITVRVMAVNERERS